MRNRPYNMLMPYQPPPFIGDWSTVGCGAKKKKERERAPSWEKFVISLHYRSDVLKPVFVNEPISNHNLRNWCGYLNIPKSHQLCSMHNKVYVRRERVIVKDVWLGENNWLHEAYLISTKKVFRQKESSHCS